MVGEKRLGEGEKEKCANSVCKEEGNSATGTKEI